MSMKDARGLSLGTSNRAAVEHFDRAVALFLDYRGDPMGELEAALAADPALVMAHAMKGAMLCTATERAAVPLIEAVLAAAGPGISTATERERAHLAAVKRWADGDIRGAVEAWGRIAMDEPRDTVAVQFAHLGDFFLGQSTMLRDRVAQALHRVDAGLPGYGNLLGMHAFGLEECGEYARAEAEGRRAASLNARDGWAVHAVAHVMEMTGRAADGIAWLNPAAAPWNEASLFAYHNWWHRALFHMELGDWAAALAEYDTRVRPQPTALQLQMLDASALLWRLHLRGVDVGDRWVELADKWQAVQDDRYYAFNDAHAMFALVATGRLDVAQRLLDSVAASCAGAGTNADMARDVGLPLCAGILAFGRGDHAVAAETLLAVRPVAQRFGGSHAQRDIITMTLLEAAHRAGLRGIEAALLAERRDAKPDTPLTRLLLRRAA